MECVVRTIKIGHGRNDWIYIVPLGDFHVGNTGCALAKLKRQVEYIKNKVRCYWIGMGDYVDCINYTDKRFDPDTVAEPFCNHLANCVPLQVETVIKILEPIKHKCLGLLRGNHEEKIRLKYQFDILEKMSRAFDCDIPLLKDSAILRLRFVRSKDSTYVFDIFCTHGCSGGRKGGAKVNRLEDMIGYVEADIYLMGHSHIKITESRSVLYADINMNLKHKKKVMGVTGCFLNGYQKGKSSYVEKWGFPPTSTGSVKIMINPRRHDVHISE